MNSLNKLARIKVGFLLMSSLMSFLAILTACSSTTTSTYVEGDQISIDIFAGRGFLGGSSYERYYLDGNTLWRECGNVTREDNVKSSEILSAFTYHPNLKLVNTGQEILTDSEFKKIASVASELFSSISDKGKAGLPGPESLFSMANAGVFEIRISYNGEERSFVTSLDGINSGLFGTQVTARRLFTQIRGVGPVMCASRTFFGIERR